MRRTYKPKYTDTDTKEADMSKMIREITVERLKEILLKVCDSDTTLDAENWTPDNPLLGHCAVVSTVAQNLFGGKLLRASLEGTPFEYMRSHYWNELPGGTEVDFTAPQFEGNYPELKGEERERDYVLSYEETNKRYKLLAFRIAKEMSGNSALFDDDTYKECFFTALDTPCQKMGFGCVVKHEEEVVYISNNAPSELLADMCEPECIRLSIESRTESMLGACMHAEERALWSLIDEGISPRECDFYVAGVRANGLPYIKNETIFTCLRCANQLNSAGVARVFVPVNGGWQSLTSEEAVVSAKTFALKEKRV